MLTKQEILLGKGTLAENSRIREPRRIGSATWLSLGFYGDGISSGLSLANHFDSGVLPGGACPVQPRWMLSRRVLGGSWACGVTF